MSTTLIIFCLAIVSYIGICIHCAQTGKDRGLEYSEIFLLSLFGSPVTGYLHMLLVFTKKTKEQAKIEQEATVMKSEYRP